MDLISYGVCLKVSVKSLMDCQDFMARVALETGGFRGVEKDE